MAKVEIYLTQYCPFCVRAKQLLDAKGIDYVEIDLEQQPAKRQEMLERAQQRHTVPQIFINNVGIGGCDDLYHLHHTNKLDTLLNQPNTKE